MAKRMSRRGHVENVGYGKPPRHSQFRPGESGNRKGRPKGAKNFATVLAEELNRRVPVTENGKRKNVSKRQVIVKQTINKAAGGDLKAVQMVLNESRPHEDGAKTGDSLAVFDTPEHQLVMADIVRRIRQMDEEALIVGASTPIVDESPGTERKDGAPK